MSGVGALTSKFALDNEPAIVLRWVARRAGFRRGEASIARASATTTR